MADPADASRSGDHPRSGGEHEPPDHGAAQEPDDGSPAGAPSEGESPDERTAREDLAREDLAGEDLAHEHLAHEDTAREDSARGGMAREETGRGELPSGPLTDHDVDVRFADIVALWEGRGSRGDGSSGGPSADPSSPGSAPGTPARGDTAASGDSSAGPVPPTDAVDPSSLLGPAWPGTIKASNLPPYPSTRPDDADERDEPGAGGAGGAGGTRPPEPTPWRVHVPPEDPDDEDYTPPPPRPLPAGDLGFWGALFGLVVGPLWLIYIAVAAPVGSGLAAVAALALTVGGFAIIVARLPRGRRPADDEDDDGAVV